MSHDTPGRVLAIDLGEKRIGLAISDPLRLVARPYAVIQRRSRREDFERIGTIIEAESVVLIVMGLPIPLSGVEGQRAAWVRDYTAELATHLTVPIIMLDESFSTKRAAASLREQGLDARRQRERIDAVAAAFILQDFLDGQAG